MYENVNQIQYQTLQAETKIGFDTDNRVFLEIANQCTTQIERGDAALYYPGLCKSEMTLLSEKNSDFPRGTFEFLQQK